MNLQFWEVNMTHEDIWYLVGLERLEKRRVYYVDVGQMPRFLTKRMVSYMIKRYKNGR